MKEVNEEIPAGLEAEEVEAHFSALPARYFQIHGATDIAEDIELAHRFMEQQVYPGDNALAPTTRWKHHRDRGYSDVRICTWDRAGLFSKIAGTLSAVGLNILSAQIFTRTDGIVLDVFSVTDGRTGSLVEAQQTEKFDQLMRRVLMNEGVDLAMLIAKQTRARTLYQAYTGEQIPTQITLDNEASETRSLIEIETEDRIGLLYTISQTLAELHLNISAAKISTEKGAAIDSFYVNTTEGGKIGPERWEAIEPILSTAIEKLQPR
jgi:[protein-PII] uridylyltransferase